MTTLRDRLIRLFDLAAKAHFEAFKTVNGEDADWPVWYAQYLQSELSNELSRQFTVSELVYCLIEVETERQARAPDADWRTLYADHFLERFAPPQSPAADRLELYQTAMCPFCQIVREAIGRIGVDVKLRDVAASREFYDELYAARGRGAVPVLKVISMDGVVRWMPESRDIIRYLETHYG